jgi:hypothetical protein
MKPYLTMLVGILMLALAPLLPSFGLDFSGKTILPSSAVLQDLAKGTRYTLSTIEEEPVLFTDAYISFPTPIELKTTQSQFGTLIRTEANKPRLARELSGLIKYGLFLIGCILVCVGLLNLTVFKDTSSLASSPPNL